MGFEEYKTMIKKLRFDPESDFIGQRGMKAIENKLNELIEEVNRLTQLNQILIKILLLQADKGLAEELKKWNLTNH